MRANFSPQSGLGRAFWDWLALAGLLPSVRAIVGRLQPWT